MRCLLPDSPAPTAAVVAASATWCLLRQVYGEAIQTLEQRLRPTGITVRQATAVAVLARSDPPLTVSGLAAALHQEKQSTNGLINRLVERGWVRRTRDPADGRAVHLVLTGAGAAVVTAMGTIGEQTVHAQLAVLRPAELPVLQGLLQRLVDRAPAATSARVHNHDLVRIALTEGQHGPDAVTASTYRQHRVVVGVPIPGRLDGPRRLPSSFASAGGMPVMPRAELLTAFLDPLHTDEPALRALLATVHRNRLRSFIAEAEHRLEGMERAFRPLSEYDGAVLNGPDFPAVSFSSPEQIAQITAALATVRLKRRLLQELASSGHPTRRGSSPRGAATTADHPPLPAPAAALVPLARHLRDRLARDNLTITAAATQIGIGRATLSQFLHGGSTQFRAPALAAVAAWLEISPDAAAHLQGGTAEDRQRAVGIANLTAVSPDQQLARNPDRAKQLAQLGGAASRITRRAEAEQRAQRRAARTADRPPDRHPVAHFYGTSLRGRVQQMRRMLRRHHPADTEAAFTARVLATLLASPWRVCDTTAARMLALTRRELVAATRTAPHPRRAAAAERCHQVIEEVRAQWQHTHASDEGLWDACHQALREAGVDPPGDAASAPALPGAALARWYQRHLLEDCIVRVAAASGTPAAPPASATAGHLP